MVTVDSELIVFIDEALSEVVELLCRLVTPPVHQVTVLVKLTTYQTQQPSTKTHYHHSLSPLTLTVAMIWVQLL